MRLLQVSLRSSLLYSLALVLVSIPVSFYAIREIVQKEVDESLKVDQQEFVEHLKNFENLSDLAVDLQVLDQLTHDVKITPGTQPGPDEYFQTIEIYDDLENEAKPVRELTTKIFVQDRPYVLRIQKSLITSENLARAILEVQVILVILLVAGLIIISGSLSKHLWQPFYETLNKLKEYELDRNQSFEYVSSNIAEFDDLNTAIQQLSSKNKVLFQQQKEFIENASHELQTPIAIFQSKLDILMQQPGLTETEAGLIGELGATAQRMARLNRNIILLSKIDNEQFSEVESIALDKQIAQQIEQIRPLISIRNISLTVDMETTVVIGNRALVEILIQNLLTNAKRHNVPGGQINISLKNKQLVIRNSGLPLQNPDKIFDRFSKESSVSASLGLGLAIVKKICTISKYDIHYSFKDGMHQFTVSFERRA